MKNHEPLRNQTLLSFDNFCRNINARIRKLHPDAGPLYLIHDPLDGQDDGPGRPLADRRRSHVDGLREQGRPDWFLDDDQIDDADPAGPDPTYPAAA
ncbi:MAG TPA: hypothetical protein VMY42_28175 [Thermoguttaceae bacterium]|nr:hypothetical protein [Thermoguttaceae bacterium]